MAVVAGNMPADLTVNNIKFTKKWSAFPDNATDKSEISNDIGGFKTLMIVGNKSAGAERRVGIWDRLNVNGNLHTTRDLILDGTNKWIIHTPNDGRKTMYIAPATDDLKSWKWGQGLELETNGNLVVKNLLKVSRGKDGWPAGWGGGIHTWDLKSDGTGMFNNLVVNGTLRVGGRDILAELDALKR
jgi:hypothetical protein